MFNRRQKRDEVIKNRRELKGSRVVISEDLTTLNQQTLNLRVSERTNSTWSHNGQVMFTLPGDTWRYMTGLGSITIDDYDYGYDYMSF